MIDDKYEFIGAESEDYFEFVSIGPKGKIKKAVQFTLIDEGRQVYNLGMGDIEPKTEEILDKITTDNQDTQKILSTIGEIARQFLEHNSSASIFIEGTTSSRNRLYRMSLNKYLDKLKAEYMIFGLKE